MVSSQPGWASRIGRSPAGTSARARSVLYEMLSGVRPFHGENSASVISAILRDTPPPVTEVKSNLPQRLSRIIRQCLEKDPQQRYPSARGVRRDLEDLRGEVASGQAVISTASAAVRARWAKYGQLSLLAGPMILAALAGIYLWKDRLPPPASEAPRIASLAVLPLENFTGDPDQEYFVDGMTDALITDLSKIGSLTVLSRTTAMRYKGTDKTLPEIAQELNVDAVVEGSVLRDSGRVQIKTQHTAIFIFGTQFFKSWY